MSREWRNVHVLNIRQLNHHLVLIIHMILYGVSRILIPKTFRYIIADEPNLAIDNDSTNRTELRIIEHSHAVFGGSRRISQATV